MKLNSAISIWIKCLHYYIYSDTVNQLLNVWEELKADACYIKLQWLWTFVSWLQAQIPISKFFNSCYNILVLLSPKTFSKLTLLLPSIQNTLYIQSALINHDENYYGSLCSPLSNLNSKLFRRRSDLIHLHAEMAQWAFHLDSNNSNRCTLIFAMLSASYMYVCISSYYYWSSNKIEI